MDRALATPGPFFFNPILDHRMGNANTHPMRKLGQDFNDEILAPATGEILLSRKVIENINA